MHTTTATTFSEHPLASITEQPGFNTRRYFDQSAMETLTESIRQQGVIQPIVLRPNPEGGYWVVAGHRRFRAATLAGLATIPAVVRDYTDAQALFAAHIENQDRDAIGPSEEAQYARRALGACEGDEKETARLLGWTETKLKQRLLLLNASQPVLDALGTKQIKIGHAELLCQLDDAMQEKVLAKLLLNHSTVEQLRDQMATFTQDLSAAPFSTAGCKGCPHNSSLQASLFDHHVGAGRCANRPCWDQKTEAFLAEKKAELATEVPAVWFDREKNPEQYVKLEALGTFGVGTEQLEQGCKACANFGALICTRPGKAGQSITGICFDRACHEGKVKEHREALAEQSASTTAAEAPADQSPEASKTSEKSAAKAKNGKPGKATKPAPKARASAAAAPSKLRGNIHAQIRTAAALVVDIPAVALAVEVFALERVSGHVDPKKRIPELSKMAESELQQLRAELVHKLLVRESPKAQRGVGIADEWDRTAARLITTHKTPLAGQIVIDKDFLEANTKSGLEALMHEARFWTALPGADEKEQKAAMKKLLTEKHGDIVKTLLKNPEPFKGLVPAVVSTELATLNKN